MFPLEPSTLNATRWDPLVIFAQPAADAQMCVEALQTLKIPYKRTIGYYEGQLEFGFVIVDDAGNLHNLWSMGLFDSQDTILALSPQEPHSQGKRIASIVGAEKYAREHADIAIELGEFLKVSQAEALGKSAWTMDLTTGEFWTTPN